MPYSPMKDVVHHLRNLTQDNRAGATDGELLTSFVQNKDEEALAALVSRHGNVVWGVCRRLLGSQHDSEDAFQATFLVLARKASAIRDKEAVGNWLYGVARQTAVRLRAIRSRRRQREQQMSDLPDAAAKDSSDDELLALLDEELSQLPDKYRVLIVLCLLEGRTRKDVASRLGCPEGTVAGRLARARVILARRLARRGVTIPGGAALTALFAREPAPAEVASLAVESVNLVAAGKTATGLVSVRVAVLAEEVSRIMLLKNLEVRLCLALLLAVVALAASGVAPLPQAIPLPLEPAQKP